MKPLFKNHIDSIRPYEPGKPLEEVQRELGLREVIKLASNENPLGTSKKALRAIRKFASRVFLYPDGNAYYLKRKLAELIGVSENHLILGNGSNEIIEFLVKGFVKEGDKVVSSACSFLVYPLVTRTLGGQFVEVPMKDFRYDLKGILKQINGKARLIFIANPNNPTGTYVHRDEVHEFVDKVPEEVMICFDEAYFDFVEAADFPDTLSYVKRDKPNVIVLRTFSKSYGLAGLRVGYGIAPPELVAYLNKIRQPFNVNSMAQMAALAALEDRDFLKRTKEAIREGKGFLYKEFDRLGFRYFPSEANFILVDIQKDGEEMFRLLLKRGVIVRSMKAYGLDTFIRVTIGKPNQNRKFVSELKQLIQTMEKGVLS